MRHIKMNPGAGTPGSERFAFHQLVAPLAYGIYLLNAKPYIPALPALLADSAKIWGALT